MGLLAALFWGITDFLVGINARTFGVKRAVFISQSFGMLLMALILITTEHWKILFSAPAAIIALGITASLFTLTGALALSKALQIGKTSIVAPLVTTYGSFTTLLAWLTGELLSGWQLLGTLACTIGVFLASASRAERGINQATQSNTPIIYALLAAMLYGTSFWIQGKFVLPTLGPVNMLALGYTIGVPLLIMELIKFSRAPVRLSFSAVMSLLGASAFNLLAFYFFSWGALNGAISIVTVVSTLSGAIAAFLGFLFLQERLSLLQFYGVGLAIAGAASIHFFG